MWLCNMMQYYIYIYTYIHSYIHTYIHTYIIHIYSDMICDDMRRYAMMWYYYYYYSPTPGGNGLPALSFDPNRFRRSAASDKWCLIVTMHIRVCVYMYNIYIYIYIYMCVYILCIFTYTFPRISFDPGTDSGGVGRSWGEGVRPRRPRQFSENFETSISHICSEGVHPVRTAKAAFRNRAQRESELK